MNAYEVPWTFVPAGTSASGGTSAAATSAKYEIGTSAGTPAGRGGSVAVSEGDGEAVVGDGENAADEGATADV